MTEKNSQNRNWLATSGTVSIEYRIKTFFSKKKVEILYFVFFLSMQLQIFSSPGLPSPFLAARLEFSVLCSTMMPLRFHFTGGCWGWIKTFRENHIDCQSCQVSVPEARKGLLPLQTVETEANGDSRSTYDMGPSLAGLVGLLCGYKRVLSCLDCSSWSSTKYSICFITLHLSRSPSKLGNRQTVVTSYLSLNKCLWHISHPIFQVNLLGSTTWD